MFGRKKRRQEPISAVVPEPATQASWQTAGGAEGGAAMASGADDRGGDSPDVSRETSVETLGTVDDHAVHAAERVAGTADSWAHGADRADAHGSVESAVAGEYWGEVEISPGPITYPSGGYFRLLIREDLG